MHLTAQNTKHANQWDVLVTRRGVQKILQQSWPLITLQRKPAPRERHRGLFLECAGTTRRLESPPSQLWETRTSYIFGVWSRGPLWGSTSTDIWSAGEGRCEMNPAWRRRRSTRLSCRPLAGLQRQLTSHREYIPVSSLNQEAGCITACHASLKYANVFMLFRWETKMWGSLDWWRLQMDWNYVQFVFFHSGSFESVGYLHIFGGNTSCSCERL